MQVECSCSHRGDGGGSVWKSWLLVFGFAAAFLLLRLPLIYRQTGGHDEELFAIPGWTVLQEGIPRIPFLPSRDPDKYVYKADVVAMMLPPAYFYWQAAVFAVFGPGYASAQLASALAGVGAVVLVYRLGLRFYGTAAPALWAAGLYSFSRLFYLPAIHSRPDSLCAAISLGAVLAAAKWHVSGRRLWLALAGVLGGLALLTHPFGIVACVQVGVWALLAARGWRNKLISAALAASCALLVFAAWLPMILTYYDIFCTQFFSNVLNRAGPGLLYRFIWPWESIAKQSRLFAEHSGVWQTALLGCGLAIATVVDFRRSTPGRKLALWLSWSSVLLLAIFQGTHDMKSYWCYPGAFLFLCLGRSIEVATAWMRNNPGRKFRWASLAGCSLLLMLMLPGSGLRALAVQLLHWNDIDYNKRRFVEKLLRDLPEDAVYAVDSTYVVDFYLAGRKTILVDHVEDRPYDYCVLGPSSLYLKPGLSGRKWRTYGIPNSSFACYAEVYRSF